MYDLVPTGDLGYWDGFLLASSFLLVASLPVADRLLLAVACGPFLLLDRGAVSAGLH